jgi:hypothetical protein
MDKSAKIEFTRAGIRALDEEAERVLKEYFESRGITVEPARGSYGDGYAELKFRFTNASSDGAPAGSEAEAFRLYASTFGLKPEDLGRSVQQGGKTLTIVGLRSRAPRKPLVLKGEDGKTYIAAVEGIKAILRLQDAKEAANLKNAT